MGAIVWQAVAISQVPRGLPEGPDRGHRSALTVDQDPTTAWSARAGATLEVVLPPVPSARAVRLRILAPDAGAVTVQAVRDARPVGEARAALGGAEWRFVEVPLTGLGVERLVATFEAASPVAEIEVEVDADELLDPRAVSAARAELAGAVRGYLPAVDGFDTPFAAASYVCTDEEPVEAAVLDRLLAGSAAVRAAARLERSDAAPWRFAPTEAYPLPPGTWPWRSVRSLLRTDLFTLTPDPDARVGLPGRTAEAAPPVRILGDPRSPRAMAAHTLVVGEERAVTYGEDIRWTLTWSHGQLDGMLVRGARWDTEERVPDPASRAATPSWEALIVPVWDGRRVTGWESWSRVLRCGDDGPCEVSHSTCRGE